MSHLAERNERQSRRHALVLAVALHLALAALLYLHTIEEPAGQLKKTAPVNSEKERPAPAKPRAASLQAP